MKTFEEIREEVQNIGSIKVEKMENGWKLSTESKLGRGTQVIALTDEDAKDLVKILSK
jgi:hypothetical protein